MKLAAKVGALALLAAAMPTYAATYAVSTTMTSYMYQPPPGQPPAITVAATFFPVATASGLLNIDATNSSVSGELDYTPFGVHSEISLIGYGLLGTTDYFYPHSHSLVSGSTGSYDAATRTLTLTNVIYEDTGEPATCSITGVLLCETPSSSSNSFLLTLVFDPTFNSFTGSAVDTGIYSSGDADVTTWSISGTQVPVPAAAWLFGSGLLALGGAKQARRRPLHSI